MSAPYVISAAVMLFMAAKSPLSLPKTDSSKTVSNSCGLSRVTLSSRRDGA
jgi:hypothetical protein